MKRKREKGNKKEKRCRKKRWRGRKGNRESAPMSSPTNQQVVFNLITTNTTHLFNSTVPLLISPYSLLFSSVGSLAVSVFSSPCPWDNHIIHIDKSFYRTRSSYPFSPFVLSLPFSLSLNCKLYHPPSLSFFFWNFFFIFISTISD